MKILPSIILVIFTALISSTSVWGGTKNIEIREIEKYPFHANSNRETRIKKGYKRVKAGMTPKQVSEILGEPDEIRYLYEPRIKTGKRIGYTHWFIIRRLVKSGSVNYRDESLVRISYSFEEKVIGIDSWGIVEETR